MEMGARRHLVSLGCGSSAGEPGGTTAVLPECAIGSTFDGNLTWYQSSPMSPLPKDQPGLVAIA